MITLPSPPKAYTPSIEAERNRVITRADSENLKRTNIGTTAGTVAAGDHTRAYEPALGDPDSDGKVLSSTAAGVRSWVAQASASQTPWTDDIDADGHALGGVKSISIEGATGTSRLLEFHTGTVKRWEYSASDEAESGSNAGSNWILSRYADDGTWLSWALKVDRATGDVIVSPAGGGYNNGHLCLGGYHIWVDTSGRLRIKSSAPSSATDGTIVGTQS